MSVYQIARLELTEDKYKGTNSVQYDIPDMSVEDNLITRILGVSLLPQEDPGANLQLPELAQVQ